MDKHATERKWGQNSSSGMNGSRVFVRSIDGLLVAAAVVLTASAAWAAPYTKIVVFGDSLSDVGNERAQHGNVGAPNYYTGRNSNGLLWVDGLAAALGEPALSNSLAGGTDFAYGGATASNIGNWTPGLTSQLNTYLTGVSQRADPGALYIVWAGANDFLSTLVTTGVAPNTLMSTISQSSVAACHNGYATWAGYVSGTVSTLYTAGARNFLVPNLPALSKTPALKSNTTPIKNSIDAEVVNFNNTLSSNLSTLATLPGIDIKILDDYTLLNQAIASPTGYLGAGANVSNACYPPTGLTSSYSSSIASHYLFWDYIHPSAAGHKVLADAAALLFPPSSTPASPVVASDMPVSPAPEPGTLVLLAIGAGMWVALTARYGRCWPSARSSGP
jgi:phospholipase/lecithinase/hemolysin